MRFLSPWVLLLGAALPLLGAGYGAAARRRSARDQALAAQGFAPNEAARRARRTRHAPFAALLASLALLVAAGARPEVDLSSSTREGTVILAFDVSNSMAATDLEPTRMEAAKAAARSFVARQPSTIRIGVVAFSDGGLVTLAPTAERADVLAAVERLTPQGATSLGQGLVAALNAIAGEPLALDGGDGDGDGDGGPAAGEANPDTAGAFDGVEVGYYGSSAVVLLTDGENTAAPDPLEVAAVMSLAGVEVYTVGVGSPEGTVLDIEGFSVATALDEAVLADVAALTGGEYFRAGDTEALARVYDGIELGRRSEREPTEVTSLAAAAGMALALVAAAFSLVRYGKLV